MLYGPVTAEESRGDGMWPILGEIAYLIARRNGNTLTRYAQRSRR